MYFTVTNPDITIHLTNGKTRLVLINSIELPKADAYNIMVCISRMVGDAGSRYIYISIGDAIHDKVYKRVISMMIG